MAASVGRKLSVRVRGGESERRNVVILVSVVTASAVIGAVLLVVASHLDGPLRYVLGAVGVFGVGFLFLWIGAIALCALGWGFFAGTFREQPSNPQRFLWAAAAVVLGAVLGTGTYASGPIALISGPALLALVAAVLKSQGFDRPFVNRRVIWFVALAAVVSLGSRVITGRTDNLSLTRAGSLRRGRRAEWRLCPRVM